MQLTAPCFDEDEINNLKACLSSGWVTQGPYTKQFETLVAERHQVKFGLAVTSCTAALHLAVLALGLTSGDEIIVPAFTWVTSAHCAEYVGAKVVFVDVNPLTFNIDPIAVEAAITPRTRAIVAVHLFGLSVDMDAINSLAKKHDLKVIEDAACAIGTKYKGKPVGGLGDVGCFSFHPRKILTTGEGGMVTTNLPYIAKQVQNLRNHGATGMPAGESAPWTMANFDVLGFNFRLSDIQAAVGVAQVSKLDKQLAERNQAAYQYSYFLSEVDEVILPTKITAPELEGHTFQSYVIRIQRGQMARNQIMLELAKRDIQTRPGTHAVHRLGYYREKYQIHSNAFPNANLCEDTTITLPIFPGITADDQQLIVQIVKQALLS